MKVLILFFFFLLLFFLILKNSEISRTGEFITSKETTSNKNDTKWKVVTRVEILNGKIINVTRNVVE